MNDEYSDPEDSDYAPPSISSISTVFETQQADFSAELDTEGWGLESDTADEAASDRDNIEAADNASDFTDAVWSPATANINVDDDDTVWSADILDADTNMSAPDASNPPSDSNGQNEESNPASDATGDLPDVELEERPQSAHSEPASLVLRQRERSPDGPPAKIQKTGEERAPSRRVSVEDNGEMCSICFDSWSNSGQHRLVALKCGHLFGHCCVVRWLQNQPARNRQCPTCKSKAAVRDIRFLYARKLVAVDTSELDGLRQQLETVKVEKTRVELELQTCQLSARHTSLELDRLRSILQDLKSMNAPERRNRDGAKWHFSLEKTLQVANDSSCRVLAYNCRKYELYASQKSTANLFPGYGIRKMDCANFKPGHFVYVHPKTIRDMQYSPSNDLIVTVSLDKTAKLICGQNSQITNTVRTEMPLWSCCWDRVRINNFLVGGPGGVTLMYDMRNLDVPVERMSVPFDISPVISLASTPDGFLTCHLNSCWFYRRFGSSYEPFKLPIDGPFLSLNYDERSKHLLVSCRPTQGYKYSRHLVAALGLGRDLACDVVHTFAGSSVQTLMSRSCQMRLRTENWIAAHNESAAAVSLYSADTFQLMQSLATQDPVVDMCSLEISGNNFLATLSNNKTRIYKGLPVSC